MHNLPYSTSNVTADTMCDEHPRVPAVVQMQGETDSFGCEYSYMCQTCLDEARKHQAADRIGICDWCRKPATNLKHHRDWEEGSHGPVYRVCGNCRVKEIDAIRREAEYEGRGDPY